jgi:hypothetical protein
LAPDALSDPGNDEKQDVGTPFPHPLQEKIEKSVWV